MNGNFFNGANNCPANNGLNMEAKTCNQCGEKRQRLDYVIPTQSGKREFCSEPCLSAYRNPQKGLHTLNIQVGIHVFEYEIKNLVTK